MNDYQIIKKEYLKFLKKNEVGKSIIDKIGKFNNFYLPLSEWIYSIYKKERDKNYWPFWRPRSGEKYNNKNFKIYLKKYGVELCFFIR